jgi:hypothetical protein
MKYYAICMLMILTGCSRIPQAGELYHNRQTEERVKVEFVGKGYIAKIYCEDQLSFMNTYLTSVRAQSIPDETECLFSDSTDECVVFKRKCFVVMDEKQFLHDYMRED